MKLKILICLSFLTITCSYNAYSQDIMKILSYNILNGFQSDSNIEEKYLQWIKNINPDVIAYQEMNHFTQDRLEIFASQYGHPYAILSKTEGYPVALSSKHPIINVQRVIDNMTHAYIYANTNNTHVFVVHLSPSSCKKRSEEIKLVLTHAATLPTEDRILIMGDFNAFDKKDTDFYNEDIINEIRAREIKYNHSNLVNGKIDYSVMNQMELNGYKDTYWLVNNKFKHSMPTNKYSTRPIRRVDYIWANSAIEKNIIKSTIIHDKDTEKMSDHYPIYIEVILK